MKKITAAVRVLLCAGLTAVLLRGLQYVTRPVNVDHSISTIRAFHSLPENSIEVIGLGSSHIWRGLSPEKMYADYGIGCYNYGNNWQHINTTRLFLQDALKTQKPRVALVETYNVGGILRDCDMDGEIYYTRELTPSSAKDEYLQTCFGNNPERYFSYWFPLAAFHENWKTLESSSFRGLQSDVEYFLESMGGMQQFAEAVPAVLSDPDTFPEEELPGEVRRELDQIVGICRENDIDIVFFTVPYEGEYKYGDAMEKYAGSTGCSYLNLFDAAEETGIDPGTDFKDPTHLNRSGAEKVSDYLSRYLKENYELTDFRSVPGNLWEKGESLQN